MTVASWYDHLGIVFWVDIWVLITIKKCKLSRKINWHPFSSFWTCVTVEHSSHVTKCTTYPGSQLLMEIKWSAFNICSLLLSRLLAPFLDSCVTQNPIQTLSWSRVMTLPLPGLLLRIQLSAQGLLRWVRVKLSVTDFIPKNRMCSHDSPYMLQLWKHSSQCQK